MANTRIKDISTAATTLNSDDFIAVDGSTAGTRKMAKADLISEVSSGVSGTYLEESNNLSDVASLDTSKLNMEIPDVGSSPDQVSLNGMLGDMAFQSSDGVSVASLEVTDKIVDSVEVNASVKPVIRLSGSGNDADGTNYGAIEFYNRDASIDGPNVGAQIHVESSSVNGAGGELVFSTERSSSEGEGSAPLERVRIDDSGRVGIGTASPSAVLEATGAGTGGRGLKITETSTSKTSGVYTLEVDSSAHGSNMSAAGAMKIDVASGRAMTVDGVGRVGIGTTSPSSYDAAADDLVVGDSSTATNSGVTVATVGGGVGSLYFADGTAAPARYAGYVVYNHGSNSMAFGTNANTRWLINSSGDLVANGAHGIDFGSATTGSGNTVTSGLLDDYEEGDWTPSPTSGSITGTGLTYVGKYTKIGRMVQIYIRVNATAQDINVSSYVGFTGVPFSISTKASGTVIGEDIDQAAQQGFAALSSNTLFFGACGNSTAIGLTATLTGYI